MSALAISPLSLDSLCRDLWGEFDAAAIQQLAPLAFDSCYQPKLIKAPDSLAEVLPAFPGYVEAGIVLPPGSILYGFYLPSTLSPSTTPSIVDPTWSVQIIDAAIDHKLYDEPVPAAFLSNFKPTSFSAFANQAGSFPHLLPGPYPIVGSGMFQFQFWNRQATSQRIELVVGVLEAVK